MIVPDTNQTVISGLPRSIVQPARIGRIVSVSGGRIIALLDQNPDAQPPGFQVGSLVKIPRPGTLVFGVVEGLSIPIPRETVGEQEPRLAEINLLGELPDGFGPKPPSFRRGVSSMPGLDDVVLAADSDDTAVVYALPERQTICLGTVHQDSNVSAYVSVDDLLGRHFAIVGATGAGKSSALALLLHGIIEANPNAHVLLLDPHGEYGKAFGERTELLTIDRLQIPYWVLEFEELIEIIFGSEKESMAAEIALLRQLVVKARLAYAQGKRRWASITVDTPTPYTFVELNRLLDEELGKLDNRALIGPATRLKTRLGAVQGDPRFAFLFPRGIALMDNLAAILGQLFRIPTEGKPLCTLDLTGISSEILNVVVAVLSRLAFNLAVSIGQQMPVLLICEEAHRYAPEDTSLGFEPAKRSLARIAKEGRKYGISLGVLSQRPSDLAVSILSQCSTVLAFRMVNNADQDVIQAALSDASSALVSSLPLLGNGEAVIVGEGVAVPMRVRLAQLPPERRPRSNSALFSHRWQEEEAGRSVLERIVDDWRGRAAAA